VLAPAAVAGSLRERAALPLRQELTNARRRCSYYVLILSEMAGQTVLVADERGELLARQLELEHGAAVALRLSIARWLKASSAVSCGYLRHRQLASTTIMDAVDGSQTGEQVSRLGITKLHTCLPP
jgi:hypothetical protein